MFSYKMWKEYLLQRYVIDLHHMPLLIMMAVVAARSENILALALAAIANYVMTVFAFMYNDVADRVEDGKSPGKRFKNPFSYNIWSLPYGAFLLALQVVFSLAVSWWIGGWVLFVIAAINLIFGYLYSSNFIRLKGLPLIDLLSHSFLLGGVTILYFMFIPGAMIDVWSWLIFAAVMLFSIGGDLHNEYRDFEDDREAGLSNTASFIGKDASQKLAKVAWVISALSAVVGIIGAIGSLL
jgi:4-hydroxybenzoate polyprenyltransferase